jgi:hypothetical protein
MDYCSLPSFPTDVTKLTNLAHLSVSCHFDHGPREDAAGRSEKEGSEKEEGGGKKSRDL